MIKTFKHTIDYFTKEPRLLFIIDALGALLTSCSLLFIASIEDFVGLPQPILRYLAAVAMIFFIYSLACYQLVRATWRTCMKIIGILNLSYCLVTAYLVFSHQSTITALGITYFTFEIVIVCIMAFLELSVSNNKITHGEFMKAVVYERYGPPEVLMLQSVPKPIPQKNEVVIKIHATTVSAGDWRIRKADPFLARIFNGLFYPMKVNILGFEVAGVIEEVGDNVKKFMKGDAVFASCGLRFGGYAEYTCLPENELIEAKPSNMSFEEAASVPVGALTALRFLKERQAKPGDSALIYGASGSVGTFAVQIAKWMGYEVTAVCSTNNLELVSNLGADKTIDYTKRDFTKANDQYNLIFDAVGKMPYSKCKNRVKTDGQYLSVWRTPKANADDLSTIKSLIETGALSTVIDRRFTFAQIREAHSYVESFRKKGNVVVTW